MALACGVTQELPRAELARGDSQRPPKWEGLRAAPASGAPLVLRWPVVAPDGRNWFQRDGGNLVHGWIKLTHANKIQILIELDHRGIFGDRSRGPARISLLQCLW